MPEHDQLIERQVQEYQKLFEKRTEAYVEKAMQLNQQGPGETRIGAPITGWPPYPWLNIFVVGPIQFIGTPPMGPFKPSKIISHNNPAYILAFLWRNPAPINWVPGTPSACQMLNGRQFQVNFEVVNLTSVSEGPDLPFWADTFSNAPSCVQAASRTIQNLPAPAEGKPNLYQLHTTMDVIGFDQPIAAFATWIFDPDFDPHWMFFPGVAPHWQYERPMEFMIYQR